MSESKIGRDSAYKNRQEKVPITFIFLLPTLHLFLFLYVFLLYAYFSFRVFTFKKKESFIRISLCVLVCVCVFYRYVFRIFFGRLQNYNLQCKSKKKTEKGKGMRYKEYTLGFRVQFFFCSVCYFTYVNLCISKFFVIYRQLYVCVCEGTRNCRFHITALKSA